MPKNKVIKEVEKEAKKIGKKVAKVVDEVAGEAKQAVKKISKVAKDFSGEEKKTHKQEKRSSEEGREVGVISHFFDHISVAVVEMSGTMKVGDKIRIKGNTTDFTQKIDSMQVEHEKIKEAKKGQAIGMKVAETVRVHDRVYVI